LIPCGFLIFLGYEYYLTGDVLAYVHTSGRWFGASSYLSNPLRTIVNGIASREIRNLVGIFFALFALVYLFLYYSEIGFSYWLVGMYSIFVPLFGPNLVSMPRYVAVIFPLYIILARVRSKNSQLDQVTMTLLALLQGGLMVLWTNGAYVAL
jgi:hypothetical protein